MNLALRRLKLLILACTIAFIFSACSTDDTPPTVACTPTSLAEPLSGWRFQTDPSHIGQNQKWFAPSFDDGAWRTDIKPGQPWEQQGLTDYDGIGWFRAKVTLPAGLPSWLAISGVDDTARFWIDGEDMGGLDSTLKLLNAEYWSGKMITLAIRVVDTGGYGGIKDPIRVGGSPEQVLTPNQWAGWLASQHPDWPLPGWAKGGPAAWGMTGGMNAADEALVSSEGRVAPWATAPTAAAWLVDPKSARPIPLGDPPTFGLVSDHLPMPRWTWANGGTKVTGTLFFDETDHAVRWLVDVDNSATNVPYTLAVAVTPFAANPTAHAINAISAIDPQRVWVNGQPYLHADTRPDRVGVGRLADVLGAPSPDAKTPGCIPAGDGAAILDYSVPSGQSRSYSFAFPASAGGGFPPSADVKARLDAATKLWEDQTSRVKVSLPDGRVQNAFQASTGYLLLALDPTGPHPGPLAHDSLWVRDATYIGLALLQTGHADAVKAYLPDIWAGQSADGRVPPISGKSIPWNDDEWDAQGEAIFLTVAAARYSGDTALLGQYYPQIRKAADFIRTLRARNTSDGPAKGLLPPSLSAEDLGLGQAHYYWDDFWAVAGLREAAYAANMTGHPEEITWMSSESVDLADAIHASVIAVMGPDPAAPGTTGAGSPPSSSVMDPAYIPGSVEETKSSAAARGAVTALWPDTVFSPDDPLVKRSFDYYHQTWIEPYGGGFLHRDAQFWPVGGLELAHAYLALGRGDVLHQILGWTLSHQTLPGAYAWADEVSPSNNGVAGGDMPHAWVAASYVTLIREMLVREQGTAISLFTLAPDSWFEAGNVVSVENAPTWYGPLSIKTESTVKNQGGHWVGTLTLTLTTSGPVHPTTFVWKVPQPPSKVDGPEGTVYQDGELRIPGSGGVVTLTFGP